LQPPRQPYSSPFKAWIETFLFFLKLLIMGERDLRTAVGKPKGQLQSALNAAIRQMPGGNEALDALTLMHEMQHRLARDGAPEAQRAIAQVAMDRLGGIVNAMEASVRKKFEI
jgi:hypothetical protein